MISWPRSLSGPFIDQQVLVTGGAGFIGSHLVDALVALGARVTVIDDLSGGDWANLSGHTGRVERVTGSILDRALLRRCCEGCRVVFHLAALGSVPRSVKEPDRYTEVNVVGTINVLHAARDAGVNRVVFSGSSSAYGDPPVIAPKVETMPPLPRSPYAATKLAGEHCMRAWSHSYGLDTAVLRYFNIYGPRQNANSAYAAVIAAFSKAMLAGRPGTIFGDGRHSRDFTFVANAVHANLLAAACEQPLRGEVFNVANGGCVNLLELHAAMAKAFGLPGLVPIHEAARAGDVMHSQADISKARKVLGYSPLVEFEDGLVRTVEWYKRSLAQRKPVSA